MPETFKIESDPEFNFVLRSALSDREIIENMIISVRDKEA